MVIFKGGGGKFHGVASNLFWAYMTMGLVIGKILIFLDGKVLKSFNCVFPQGKMWSSYRDLLLRDEACVVAGQQQGGEGGHGEGPPLVWHGGLLADLEPHRGGQGK